MSFSNKSPKDSEIVKALADFASRGKYEMTPRGAKVVNDLYVQVAALINRLERQEEEEENNQLEKALQEMANTASQEAIEEEGMAYDE